MTDNEIRKIVSLVMFFVRTRRNAGTATNEEVFNFVKTRMEE